MTDFEKNTTFEELQQFEQDTDEPESDRISEEWKNEGSDKQPSFDERA